MTADDVIELVGEEYWGEVDSGDVWTDSYGTVYTSSEDWINGTDGYDRAEDGIYYQD